MQWGRLRIANHHTLNPHTHPQSNIPTQFNSRYAEQTSEWTLDYPPFFAFFERGLAALAAALLPHDPGILRVSAAPYASEGTVWFQRLTVMATDLLLLLGTWAHTTPGSRGDGKVLLLAVGTVGSVGLLLVDHMHFQYNGVLLGLLLLSAACIRRVRNHPSPHAWSMPPRTLPKTAHPPTPLHTLRRTRPHTHIDHLSTHHQERPYLGAALFAALLMCKHLFLSLAPAFFVHLLRTRCCPPPTGQFRPLPFLALGLTVLSIFALALGPFLLGSTTQEAVAQLQQMHARLFPFGTRSPPTATTHPPTRLAGLCCPLPSPGSV